MKTNQLARKSRGTPKTKTIRKSKETSDKPLSNAKKGFASIRKNQSQKKTVNTTYQKTVSDPLSENKNKVFDDYFIDTSALKTIAIVGRTNVGKSTFFNRLAAKRLAIVHDRAGVTRDRKEATAHLYDLDFRLIDTAGLEETTSLAQAMWNQTEMAIAEADIVFMVVDARTELTVLDEKLAKSLRKLDKPVLLIANKCEGQAQTDSLAQFYRLGIGNPIGFSAEHALGLGDLYGELATLFKNETAETDVTPDTIEPVDNEDIISPDGESKPVGRPIKPLQLAIVGRPNVGKSTLINRLLGQERLLTGPQAGVTRDAITVPFEWRGHKILLTDTAGMRKSGRIEDTLERFSVSDTKNAIDFAEVVILVLDANMPMEKQDLVIASKVIDEGRALIIALNKWDDVENQKHVLNDIKEKMVTSLQQVKGVPVLTISAKTGYGLDRLMSEVFTVYGLWNKRVPTHKMNTFLREMTEAHPTPIAKNGRRIPMKYITQVSARPPTFAIFSSNPDELPESYLRYLMNGLRDKFGFLGVPIRIHMRKRDNPYADKSRGRRKVAVEKK